MYPSDLTDAQWQIIKNLLPQNKRKRKYDLRIIWNAIFYLLKTGCQWRMLPKEFPKWQLVYYYFAKWKDEDIIEHIMHMVHEKVRVKMGRAAEPTAGIVDCQSVKTTRIGGLRGFDGNKKVNGRKRHIVVDTLGYILAVMVHAANIHEVNGIDLVMRKLKEKFLSIKVIFADGGYRGEIIEQVKSVFGCLLMIVLRKDASTKFEVLPKRWIIERTFSWFENSRRLSKDFEYLTDTSAAMIQLASIKLMLNKF